MSYDLNSRNRNLAEPGEGRIDHIDPAQPEDNDVSLPEHDGQPEEQVAVSDVESSELDDQPQEQVAVSDVEPSELNDQPQEQVAVSDVPESDESVAIAADEQPEQAYQERLPDELPAQPAITLWSEPVLAEMRSRWQAAQLRFVDNPAAVTGEMQVLVGHAVQTLSAALVEQQRELDGWQTAGHDTEQLRIAVQRYRAFYDLLLNH